MSISRCILIIIIILSLSILGISISKAINNVENFQSQSNTDIRDFDKFKHSNPNLGDSQRGAENKLIQSEDNYFILPETPYKCLPQDGYSERVYREILSKNLEVILDSEYKKLIKTGLYIPSKTSFNFDTNTREEIQNVSKKINNYVKYSSEHILNYLNNLKRPYQKFLYKLNAKPKIIKKYINKNKYTFIQYYLDLTGQFNHYSYIINVWVVVALNKIYILDLQHIGILPGDLQSNVKGYNNFSTLSDFKKIGNEIESDKLIMSNQNIESILNQRKKNSKNRIEDYKCFYPNIDSDQLNSYSDKSKESCESNMDRYGRKKIKGIWDSKCKKDKDCPYFRKNTNYPNTYGKCLLSGYCELPLGLEPLGYRHFQPDTEPLCHNCNKLSISTGNCCDLQKNPDYAFNGDYYLRYKHKFNSNLKNVYDEYQKYSKDRRNISSEENYNFEEDLMLNGEVEEAGEAIESKQTEEAQELQNNKLSTKIPVPAVLPYQVIRPIFYERN